jgi:hypothetical protein
MNAATTIAVSSLALGAGLVVALLLAKHWLTASKLKTRMGSVNWDPGKSWASSFTVIGALLGTILATKGVMPDKLIYLALAGYAGLQLFFGILVVVAPFLYLATSSPVEITNPQAGNQPQLQGYVWSFAVTSGLTLWAVLGELATIGLLLAEIDHVGSIPAGLFGLFIAVLSVSAVLVLIYVARSLIWIIEDQGDVQRHQDNMEAMFTASTAIQKPDVVVPPKPSWSLM